MNSGRLLTQQRLSYAACFGSCLAKGSDTLFVVDSSDRESELHVLSCFWIFLRFGLAKMFMEGGFWWWWRVRGF
jgi:hypothetical protein